MILLELAILLIASPDMVTTPEPILPPSNAIAVATGAIAGGLLAGAGAAGLAVLALQPWNSRQVPAGYGEGPLMLLISAPVFALAGALGGGAIGYLIAGREEEAISEPLGYLDE